MKTLALAMLMLLSLPAYSVTGFSSEYREHGAIASWMLPARRGGYQVEITALVNPGVYSLFDLTCTLRNWRGYTVYQEITQSYKYDFLKRVVNITFTALLTADPASDTRAQLSCKSNYSTVAKSITARINAIAVDVVKQVP